MGDKVTDPENARLVAMLRAMGEAVPEDMLGVPETPEGADDPIEDEDVLSELNNYTTPKAKTYNFTFSFE